MPQDIDQPMPLGNNPRAMLRRMLADRRSFPRASADWAWRTIAARKYINLIRGAPVIQWRD